MFPAKLLSFEAQGDLLVPSYLGAEDDPWIAELLSALDGFVGATAAEIDAAFESRINERLLAAGASFRALAGARHVCAQWFALRAAPALPPLDVRRVVFEESARHGTRQSALAAAAARLETRPERVVASLFADRPEARRLFAPAALPAPSEVAARYNLALLQGLLLHASEVVVSAKSQERSIVRYAKTRRLLCTFDAGPDALRLTISGPLSILRHTTKYGRALALFLPALAATPGWTLHAYCAIGARSGVLHANAADPVAATCAAPAELDDAVLDRLVKDLRRRASGWTIERASDPVHAGGRVFFPDLVLARGDDRVVVEILGYFTPEYLRTKLAALDAAGLRKFIVCVDESLGSGDAPTEACAVVRYRRRVDAAELLRAAEALVRAEPGESPSNRG